MVELLDEEELGGCCELLPLWLLLLWAAVSWSGSEGPDGGWLLEAGGWLPDEDDELGGCEVLGGFDVLLVGGTELPVLELDAGG